MPARSLMLTLAIVTISFGTLAALFSRTSATYPMELRLSPGEHIAEHRYENDRIDWKLPKKRLEPFIRAGVIIHEERHTTAVIHAVVISLVGGLATLKGEADVSTYDVPRHQTTHDHQPVLVMLSTHNTPVGADRLDVAEAAMVGLPAMPLHVGGRWQTRRNVVTTLGSGFVTYDHTIESLDNHLIRIGVRGSGEITGKEYHLPKLLPGTISVSGSAWFDLGSGLVTQESYAIHDTLLKPAEHEFIGFDEHLSVDISTRKI